MIGKHATTVSSDSTHTVITYQATQVVRFNSDEIILDTGGWFTPTTKKRMNQASETFNLGFHVYAKRGRMVCRLSGNHAKILRGFP